NYLSCAIFAHTYLSLSFSFNDPPTTEIYTLSLHDALPISALDSTGARGRRGDRDRRRSGLGEERDPVHRPDRARSGAARRPHAGDGWVGGARANTRALSARAGRDALRR